MFSLLSFPSLVLALLITASLNRSFLTVAMTLGIVGIAPISRLARATTIQFADREFVQAAVVIGAKSRRIIIKELLPNVLVPMGALTLLGMGISIVAEGSLAFLGLSVEGEAISWGKSIVDGSQTRDLNQNSHVAFVPIFAMFLTVMALNFAGDRIRNTPTSGRRRSDERSAAHRRRPVFRFPTSRGTVEAVNGVNFTLEKGQMLGIVGESGSGKSVTAKTLMNLLPRTARSTATSPSRETTSEPSPRSAASTSGASR